MNIKIYLRITEGVFCFNQLQYASDKFVDNPSLSKKKLLLRIKRLRVPLKIALKEGSRLSWFKECKVRSDRNAIFIQDGP